MTKDIMNQPILLKTYKVRRGRPAQPTIPVRWIENNKVREYEMLEYPNGDLVIRKKAVA